MSSLGQCDLLSSPICPVLDYGLGDKKWATYLSPKS